MEATSLQMLKAREKGAAKRIGTGTEIAGLERNIQ